LRLGCKVRTEVGAITSANGQCEGGPLIYNGEHYKDVIAAASYKITPTSGILTVDFESSTARTPQGSVFPMNDLVGFDTVIGYTFWERDDRTTSCHPTSYIVLYQGPAIIFTSHSGAETLVVNNTGHLMAVGIKKPVMICYQLAISTEHGRLYFIQRSDQHTAFYFKQVDFDLMNMDRFLYTNSTLG
jgi:hypothetical protein